jgi:hypothetical protein
MARALKAVETATAEKTVSNADLLRGMSDEQLMSKYIALRDAVDAESKAFKLRAGRAVTVMEQIEAVMIERLDEREAASTSTSDATAFFQPKTFCNVEDWDKLLAFILESGAYQFLNHSVSKAAVQEYMTEHAEDEDGTIPPGVKWQEERSLVIRRR